MAIQKIRKPKPEVTRKAVIFFAAGGVMLIVSIILSLQAVHRFRFKSSFRDGLRYYGSMQPGNALDALKKAIEIEPRSPWPRELLAKTQADSGSLLESEQQYRELLQLPYDRATVHCGLGAVHLHQADQEQDPEKRADLLGKARTDFDNAKKKDPACLEAQIGLAHCRLLEGLANGDETALGDAREAFTRIGQSLERLEVRKSVTREGMVDFYTGKGRLEALAADYSDAARSAFASAQAYAPRSAVAIANSVSMLAWVYETQPIPARDLAERLPKLQGEVVGRYRDLLLGQPETYGRLKDPLMRLQLAVAAAAARVELEEPARQLLFLVRESPEYLGRIEPLLTEAALATDSFLRPDLSPQKRQEVTSASIQVFQSLANHETMKKEANRKSQALVLNNLAVMRVALGGIVQDSSELGYARAHLEEAVALDAESYVVNRNLAVLIHRIDPAADTTKYREGARKASAAPGASPEERKDFEEMEKGFTQP